MAKGIPSKRKRKLPVERLPRGYTTLRRDKPAGTYDVDNYIGVFYPNADRAKFVRSFRLTINFAAQSAVLKEKVDRQIWPRRRDEARRIIKLLDTIDRQAAGWINPVNDDDVLSISRVFVPAVRTVPIPGSLPPERLLSQVFSNIQSIRKLRRQLISRFTTSPAGRRRADPLARYFIEVMANAYKNRRGMRPPRGRSGPFINLIAAAWRDLGFPIPAETPLEDWLGQKVEVLPDNSTKKNRSPR